MGGRRQRWKSTAELRQDETALLVVVVVVVSPASAALPSRDVKVAVIQRPIELSLGYGHAIDDYSP